MGNVMGGLQKPQRLLEALKILDPDDFDVRFNGDERSNDRAFTTAGLA